MATLRSRLCVLLLFAMLALVPAAVGAQTTTTDSDLLGRINGDLTVAAGESYGIVAVITGDVRIDGTVRDALLVIDGTATVAGDIPGEITIVNGELILLAGSSVDNATLVGSTLQRDPAAEVGGTISYDEEFDVSWQVPAAISFIIWASISLLLLVAALILAAVAGRQMLGIAGTITRSPGASLIGAAVLWFGLPILAVLLIITVIGIPVGLTVLLAVLPVLWVVGYLAAAIRVGAQITRLTKRVTPIDHPYLAALVGVIVLQLIGLIPGLGGFIVFIFGLVGAGATIVYAFRAWRNRERDWRLAPPIPQGD